MDKNKTLGHFKMQYPNRDNRIRSRKINIHSLSNGTDLKLLALKKNEDLAHEEIFSLNFFSYKEIHTEEKETVSQFNFKKLKKDEWFRWRFTTIEVLKKLSKKIALGIYFSGHALIKIGLSVPGHSFIWLGDQEWKAKKIEWKCHTIDLERFENGFLEISILPIEDSYFYASGLDHAKKIELDEAQVLYRFISPSLDLCCEEPLYYRFSGTKTWYSFEENVVYLYKNSSVDLVTYFNSFSGAKWYRYTNVETVDIFLDFMGDAVVDFVNYVGEESIVLQRWQIRSYTRALFKCETKCFPTEGVSGIIIYANAKSILYGGGYCTSVPEIQDIKLGISITTFKREKQVIKSVQRLGTAINNHPYYKNCIDISVVDNGATLEDADVPCATLIKNKNLGGTGGFTRGLVAYTENGTYTHCLFMDDDAQCEAESIFKSISFLRHALDKKTALSGAMLYANLQFLQWENGAWFDEGCHSLKRDYDLRDVRVLINNEEENEHTKKIYGAWWFFMFPIAQVKKYALPFFVRGDDIDFSYVNNFLITSLNGVASWQEDFKIKENALAVYLFIRSHIIHHFTLANVGTSLKSILKIVNVHFSMYNGSYFYSLAAAVNLALRHALQGPEFWENNLTPEKFLKIIKEITKRDRTRVLTEEFQYALKHIDAQPKMTFFGKLLKKINCDGHLLPSFFLKKEKHSFLSKYEAPDPEKTYLLSRFYVVTEEKKEYVLYKMSRLRYFYNLFNNLYLKLRLCLKYGILKKNYKKWGLTSRSKEAWQKRFL